MKKKRGPAPKPQKPKICEYCKKEFVTKRLRRKVRFCSKICGAKNRNWSVHALTPEQEERRRAAHMKSLRSEKNLEMLSNMGNRFGGWFEPIDPIFPTDEEDSFKW